MMQRHRPLQRVPCEVEKIQQYLHESPGLISIAKAQHNTRRTIPSLRQAVAIICIREGRAAGVLGKAIQHYEICGASTDRPPTHGFWCHEKKMITK
jgi:hypothetical protein